MIEITEAGLFEEYFSSKSLIIVDGSFSDSRPTRIGSWPRALIIITDDFSNFNEREDTEGIDLVRVLNSDFAVSFD